MLKISESLAPKLHQLISFSNFMRNKQEIETTKNFKILLLEVVSVHWNVWL